MYIYILEEEIYVMISSESVMRGGRRDTAFGIILRLFLPLALLLLIILPCSSLELGLKQLVLQRGVTNMEYRNQLFILLL